MAGFSALGTEFQRGDGGSPEVFTAIGGAINFTGPAPVMEPVDVTSHDTPDGYRQFVGGLKNGGEFTMEVNYDPSVHNILLGDFEDPQPRSYKLAVGQARGCQEGDRA